MSHYFVEVKKVKGSRKLELLGLHDSTSRTKPEACWGGDNCLPIPETEYNILRAVLGDAKRALEISRHLNKTFTMPKKFRQP